MLRSRLATPMVLLGVMLVLTSIGLLSSVVAEWEQAGGTYRLHKMTVNVDSSITSSSSAGFNQKDIDQLATVWGTLPIALSTKEKAVAKFGKNSASSNLMGVNGDYRHFTQLNMIEGTSITNTSVTEHSRVAVISSRVAEQLFHSEHVTQQVIRIYNTSFTVIGVFSDSDSLLSQMSDNGYGDVMIPITTLNDINSGMKISSIELAAKPNASVHGEDDVKNALLAIGKNPSQFRIDNNETMYTWIAQQKTLLLFLYGIIAILLILGLMFRQLTIARKELQLKLESEGWSDILLSRRHLPLLMRVVSAVVLAASATGVWLWISFRFYIPPNSLPEELIDIHFYLDKLRNQWQLQVQQWGYIPTRHELIAYAAAKLTNGLFWISLLGLLLFMLGIRLWMLAKVPLFTQLMRLLLFIPASAAVAFLFAGWARLSYLINPKDIIVPIVMMTATMVYIHIQKGELMTHVEKRR